MGSAFAKIGTAVAAAFTVQAVMNFGKVCLEAASDVEEMENKFNVVFQGMTDEVDAWASNFADSIGRNKNTIKEFLADNQNMFVGMGMTRQAGAKLSEQMVELALDLASFNNLEEAQAVNALSKALMGESEAAKTLGAVLNENTLAMAMNELGIKGRFDALSEAEKMEVRYQAILMQSTDAVGDCARSVDSFKGSQIRLKSATENLMESIGAKLLPVATKFISTFADGAALIVANLDDVIFVAGTLATVLLGTLARKAVTAVVASFQTAQMQLALYTMQNGAAALSQAALTGSLTLSEIAVGVLTGKITIATAAQSAWNLVMKANPIGIVVTAVAALSFGIKKLIDTQKQEIKALAGQAESAEEAAANVENLKARIAELEATDPAYWSEMNQTELDNLKLALVEAENQFAEFQEAEAAAAESAADPVTEFQKATDEYTAKATELMNKFQETYNGMVEKVSGWFAPFEQAKVTVKTSVGEMLSAMQSQADFNNSYAENLNHLKEYGLGGLAAGFQTMGKDASAYAQAIVEAVEAAGGASTEEGQAIIQQFQSADTQVQESQANLAENMTLISQDWEGTISDMVSTLAENVEGLDMNDEALEAAKSTLDGYMSGIDEKTPFIQSAMATLGAQITEALQNSIGTITIPIETSGAYSKSVGRFATGLDRVPYDEFPAILHKDEAVLTAKEASAWRAGKASGGNESGQQSGQNTDKPINITLNLTSEMDGATIARKIYKYTIAEQRYHGSSLIKV